MGQVSKDDRSALYVGADGDSDVYLKRTFKKNKSFEDAENELDSLDVEGGDLTHTLMKQRKMAARTSLQMDEHVRKLEKYTAYVGGGAQATPKKAQEEQEAANEGDKQLVEMEASGAKAKKISKLREKVGKHRAEAKRLKTITAEAQMRSDDLHAWFATDTTAADQVAALNDETLELEESYTKITSTSTEDLTAYKRRTRSRAETNGRKLKTAFAMRKASSEHVRKGKVSEDWTTKHVGWEGWGSLILKSIGGLLASALVKSLSFGTVDLSAKSEEGGRNTKISPSFATWISDFKKVKAECAEIKKTKMAGGERATKVYTFLKMLSGFWLPLVRDMAISVSLWGLVLSPFTGGASLGVTAVASGISFVTVLVKAAIELALLIWSAVRGAQLKDKHSRGYKVSKSEQMQHGSQLATDLIMTGTTGLLGTNAKSGDFARPDQVLESRFTEMGSVNPSINYGGLSTETLGLPNSSIIDHGLDNAGLGGRMIGNGVVTGGLMLAGKGADKEMKAREERTSSGRTFDKSSDETPEPSPGPSPDPAQVSGSTKKVNRTTNKLVGKISNLGSKVSGASDKASKSSSMPDEEREEASKVKSGMSNLVGVLDGGIDIEALDI